MQQQQQFVLYFYFFLAIVDMWMWMDVCVCVAARGRAYTELVAISVHHFACCRTDSSSTFKLKTNCANALCLE